MVPPMTPDLANGPLTDDQRDEARMLMSMALDGMLDAAEEERLNGWIAADAALGEEWKQWQKMDTLFTGALRCVPAAGFAERFELCLDNHEQQARRRQRVVLGVATTVGWLGALAALLCVGWIVLANQSQWMNGMARELVYYPSAMGIWLQAVQSSLGATLSEPQSAAIAGGYLAATGLLMYGWVRLLRRTTRVKVIS